ncbi:polysaccharide biosynthesis protein [Chamaesiphon minutus]|uniref:Putative nucleoside-diphosphate sugar epimerase n=1 Tax=Chamaesiphon minutus (strain ATCC 27169 / PCC 6605) TaxID=1173020 RepID=K9UI69_CHAP6|nr:nucleoside-diphosphate sugar epimerase/dehydratase [Chamaesiphon minutus]AFY94333.1 putative nucleoside-diphosphate sugar epimerase [Chamaesiphon minutus PCC 6605]
MSTKSRSLLSIEATAATLEKLINALSNHQKYTILTSVDISLFLASIIAAIGFEYGFDLTPMETLHLGKFAMLAVGIEIGLFWAFGIYRQVLRYLDGGFIITIAKAAILSCLITSIVANLSTSPVIPLSVPVVHGMLTLILTISVRMCVRLTLGRLHEINYPGQKNGGVVIYGAGSAGCILAQALAGQRGNRPIGFVDDSPYLQGRNVQGIRVYSPAELHKLKANIGFEEILLAMPSIEGQRKREILQKLQVLGVPVKTVPSIAEILSGHVSINKVRELDIEDLLGRKAIAARPELLQQDITDRVVLVTGGGGSIGSELCRQIAKQQPKLLIIYELHEFALYQMDMELGENYPHLEKVACLGSVTDAQTLTGVIAKYGVETIYHAAAYKHVPIVEANPVSGIVNNINGTLTAAKCAIACGVHKFVLISTDKAVRPTNIMGATKRVAELVLQGLADLPNHNTCFTMVRFGNVLGRSGSVVPRFREQITSGKSLTLTHADITRYFMTIPEAATLVIQAGAMAKGGEVFLLDMGEPVKIYDLATQMIRLHGMEPHKDIKIEIVGLRPGEKIYEELLIDCDAALPTGHPKIFCAREAKLGWKELSPQLTNLLNAAAQCEVTECVSVLHDLVPEYQPMGQYAKVKYEAVAA